MTDNPTRPVNAMVTTDLSRDKNAPSQSLSTHLSATKTHVKHQNLEVVTSKTMKSIDNKELGQSMSACTPNTYTRIGKHRPVVTEQQLEQRLKASVKSLGGLCWKLTSPGLAGVPDRICLLGGYVVFVELKAPGKKPRPIQQRRIQQLRDHGMSVLVVDSLPGVEEVLDALQAA